MNDSFSRREFLHASVAAGLAAQTTRGANGFFRLAQTAARWWLVTPQGQPFFALGLNHIDPAALRYPESGDLWARKYGNSMERWLKTAVRRDLLEWGFNSVGWVNEMASNGVTNHRQSRLWTFEEYQWLNVPYCVMLPFAEFHQWEAQTRHPDFNAPEFADWCDYVAREHCARLKDDPKLIGYFFVDCPAWVHSHPHSRWKGPLFDFKKLESQAGRDELTALATSYYRTCYEAVRRYDRNHLILGDRYEARGRMAIEVLRAAAPYVGVMSFQHFGQPQEIKRDLANWAEKTGKPVLLADSGGKLVLPDKSERQNAAVYREIMTAMRELPTCVGFQLCGAYLRNRIRRKGLRDEREQPDTEALAGITAVNREMQSWLRAQRLTL
jgi:hypothetical protein